MADFYSYDIYTVYTAAEVVEEISELDNYYNKTYLQATFSAIGGAVEVDEEGHCRWVVGFK